MSLKKLACLVLMAAICFPMLGHTENYKALDIYDGVLETEEIIFRAGDAIAGGSGISVEVVYVDANGEQVEVGSGKIKSVTINGEKCSDWKLDGYMGSVARMGSLVRAALSFTLKPLYAFADDEGYYLISASTYRSYLSSTERPLGRKVKLSGRIIEIAGNTYFVSLGEDNTVAIRVDGESNKSLNVNDNIISKGELLEYVRFGETEVPTISGLEFEKLEYQPLQKGDKGENVLQMKERMRVLGYFKANAELSDAYNDVCVERVKQFQENNGIPPTGIADAETLSALYSEGAKAK